MTDRLSALIVDDSKADCKLLVHELKKGFDLSYEWVYTSDDFRAALIQERFDIVLCDYTMPQFSPFDSLSIVKALNLDLPFIIISGAVGEASAVEAMRAGAHDFIIKGNWSRLLPAIKRELLDAGNRREKQRAEISLRSQSEEQQLILDNMADAMFLTDEEGAIKRTNRAATIIFGYSAEEMLSSNVNMLMSEYSRFFLKDCIDHNNVQLIGLDREVEAQKKGGECFPIHLKIAELPSPEGERRHFVVSCSDISSRKKQEEQLRRAQKMDAIGQLTGGVAHDFNNMLGVILGYGELLKKRISEDDPKQLRYLDEIIRAGERGSILTDKLLSFSRNKQTETARTNINDSLNKNRDLLAKTLTPRVEMRYVQTEKLWDVMLDEGDLQDAIVNMCINAMHAMPEGGYLILATDNVTLSMLDASKYDLEPGGYVQLVISDTGTGMDEMTRQRIFEPFYSTKEDKGTGLGMSQVYGFVKRSEGTIKVESESGYGTQITLLFPHLIDEKTVQNELVDNTNQNINLRGSETILVVDDEPAMLGFTVDALKSFDYHVLCAEGGEQALKILKAEPVDLVISDVIMPGMDGYAMSDIIQKRYPGIKIQIISGFIDEKRLNTINNQLHESLLYKPYTPDTLLIKIRQLLDGDKKNGSAFNSIVVSLDNTTPIEWSENMSVGVAEVDFDHQILLTLLKRCQQLIAANGSEQKFEALLHELLEYTQYHFKREEMYMEACQYPFLDNHRNVHQMLTKKVYAYLDKLKLGELHPKMLLEFMRNWLIDHIMVMDQAVVPYTEGKEKVIKQVFENDVVPDPRS